MSELSNRERRALGVIFVSVMALGIVSAGYLVRGILPERAAASTSDVLHPGFLSSYSFVTPTVGWTVQLEGDNSVAGQFWVFRTGDGGRRWQEQLSGHTPFTYLTALSLQFVSERNGYIAAGDPLSLYRTTDGGEHWLRLPLPAYVSDLQFVDDVSGYAVVRRQPPDYAYGPIRLLATTDGGDTWNQLPSVPNDPSFGARFRNRSEAWSGTRTNGGPYVYVSLDGAHTWTRRDLPSDREHPFEALTAVDFVADSQLVIAFVYVDSAAPPALYASSDFGVSWTPVQAPGGQIVGFEYLDSMHWWAIADRSLYETADGGASWNLVAPVTAAVRFLQLIDSRHAWAEFEDGSGVRLVQTSDGGRHWIPANVPQPA